ncbi:MAG: ComEC/Rec2 family competence protein [Rikenellaceae bacterium]
MHRKGFEASVKINNILSINELEHIPLSAKMNRWAMSRLRSLELPDEAFALAAAVGLARREQLSSETTKSYNRTGVAHLLSLSGLHLGVIMLIISAFTFFMPLMRNGHIAADVIAIIAIWLFAFMVGLSESVTRAAWMFSLLKLSSILSRRYNSLNALFTAAVAILCLNPSSLYDLGFALSFTAVAAIIVVGVPICKLVDTDYKILDFVSTSLIISCVATISTTPLISNAFGYIVLLSPITTLPLLLTIFVIILSTTLWVICPFPQLAPLFYWTLEVATTIQNYIVEWFASWEFGVIDYRLSDFGLGVSYLIVIIVGWLVVKIVPHTEPQQRVLAP